MSWPGGDWAPPSDGMSNLTDEQGRPVDLASLATFNYNGRYSYVVRQTPKQMELSLRQLSVAFDSLPQLPAFAPLFGFSKDWHKRVVARELATFAGAAGRVLTPAEADAVAYRRSKYCTATTLARPAACATALFMVYRGRKTFRFPFYTPKPASFNPSYFPLLSLTGVKAQSAWHLARFCAYGFVCGLLVPPCFHAAAKTAYWKGISSDPGLKTISTQRPDREATPPQPYRGRYEARGPVAGRPEPTTPPPPSPAAPDSQGTPKDDDSFVFDDASPVAPSQRQQERPRRPTGSPPPQSTGEGSAWERLRQRAKSGEDVWNQGGQQKTEEYTYAPSEQEKAYAKEQAQKEFDAMLERERRGVGESGGGDPTRRL